jgi:hypothetical protein
MKRSQLALAALAVSSIIIVSFNYTPPKQFVSKTFTYGKGNPNQRIELGYSDQKDPRENSIAGSTYTDTVNWTEVSSASTLQTCSDASYISSVTIHNWEKNSNKSDEDGISLGEALDAIFAEYVRSKVYPVNLEIDLNENSVSASVSCGRAGSAH